MQIITNAPQVISHLDRMLSEFRGANELGVESATQLLHELVLRAVSLRDHSIQDLADLGHPYRGEPASLWVSGVRPGLSGFRTTGDRILHEPPHVIHVQRGHLISSIGHQITRSANLSEGRVFSKGVYYATQVFLGRSGYRPFKGRNIGLLVAEYFYSRIVRKLVSQVRAVLRKSYV